MDNIISISHWGLFLAPELKEEKYPDHVCRALELACKSYNKAFDPMWWVHPKKEPYQGR